MQWGEAREQPGEENHLREIAGFLAERRRVLRPAVLWPQAEPRGLRAGFDGYLAFLRAELAVLLEQPVHLAQLVPAGPPASPPPSPSPSPGCPATEAAALIVQGAGAVGVAASFPRRTVRDQHIRLRAGELLYLPPGARYTLTGTDGARYGVLSILPPR
ncbi:hypothetical protein [Kitasatospora sp. NPDC101183]|uniref:hypothetical protein n=1 Tax=Kitasatospora sp. NPDC101183 TaxID=3364100 RepID=UPI0038270B18